MKKTKKLGIIVMASLIGIVAFLVLMVIASNITRPEEEKWKEVYVAANNIEKDTLLTESNVNSFFKVVEVPAEVYPDNVVTDKEELLNNTTSCSIKAKEIITANKITYLAEMDYAQDRFNKCSEIAINLESLDNALAGRVRKGDLIDIVIKCEDGVARKLADNVYVSHTYDSAGVEIVDSTDKATVATVLTILIEEEQKTNIVECLAKGTPSISKVLDKTSWQELETIVYAW